MLREKKEQQQNWSVWLWPKSTTTRKHTHILYRIERERECKEHVKINSRHVAINKSQSEKKTYTKNNIFTLDTCIGSADLENIEWAILFVWQYFALSFPLNWHFFNKKTNVRRTKDQPNDRQDKKQHHWKNCVSYVFRNQTDKRINNWKKCVHT